MIIRNVNIVDGTGGPPIAGAEVVIEGDRFAAIRPSGTGGARQVFDGRGGYLVPGLWEGHTHVAGGLGGELPEKVARVEGFLADYLEAGITTAIDLGGSLELLRGVRERQRTSPTETAGLFFAGPVFTGVGGWPVNLHHDRSQAREIADPGAARRAVLGLAGEVDFVKCIYDGEPGAPDKLPRPVLRAVVEAAHEAGKKALVHIKTGADVGDAVEAGADCIEHAFLPRDPEDLGEAEDVAALLAGTGTHFCPTLVTWEQLGRGGDRAYLDDLARDGIVSPEEARETAASPSFGRPLPHHPADESLARFHYGMRTIPIMRDAGVKISAGSDVAFAMSRPGALLRELQLLAAAGLPNGDVVVAATRHAAEKIGRGANEGTIAVGAVADALLLDADPLADVGSLVRPAHRIATIRRGRLAVKAG